jgi:phage terminase Nu1 subunit (DNA packaging protein)
MESIRKLKNAGIVVGSGVRGRYLLAPSVRNYVRHLREVAAGRQGNELNAVDENARLKIAQRKNYERVRGAQPERRLKRLPRNRKPPVIEACNVCRALRGYWP